MVIYNTYICIVVSNKALQHNDGKDNNHFKEISKRTRLE